MTLVIVATLSVLSLRLFLQNRNTKPADAIVGGVLNAIVIIFLNQVWIRVALLLNNWGKYHCYFSYLYRLENHRTRTEYNDHLTYKIFMFQFINSYTSLYYIAFFKKDSRLWGDSDLKDHCARYFTNLIILFLKKNLRGTPSGDVTGCQNDLTIQLLILLGTNIVIGQTREVLIP